MITGKKCWALLKFSFPAGLAPVISVWKTDILCIIFCNMMLLCDHMFTVNILKF